MERPSWTYRGLITLSIGGALLICAPGARAHGPVIGAELSGAIPLKQTAKTADLGGAAGVYAGYEFDLDPVVRLSLLANPEFSLFPTDEPFNPNSRRDSDTDLIAVMGLLGGPRLSIGVDKRFFIDGRGGYFWELAGPLNSSGAGFNVGGGFAIDFARGSALTLFGRYNESFMRAERGSHENFRFVTVGLGLEHRFFAPEPPVEAPPPPVAAPTPAPPAKKKIILRGVNFDFDKADIRPDARPVLDEAIATLKDAGDIDVAVEGHTDSVGSAAYNEGLSVRRARAVADYLARGGISPQRMEVTGFGENRPVASNDTADGRAQNRRVELNVRDN
jgi:outer membrane protein OmpA-like peptidoglycan-associated protein